MWLDNRNLKTSRNKKIGPKQEGPFEITQVLGPVTYKLALPNTWKIHPVFHATLLTPYWVTNVHRPAFSNPPPEIVKQQELYEVKEIMGHQKLG